MTKSNFHSSRD